MHAMTPRAVLSTNQILSVIQNKCTSSSSCILSFKLQYSIKVIFSPRGEKLTLSKLTFNCCGVKDTVQVILGDIIDQVSVKSFQRYTRVRTSGKYRDVKFCRHWPRYKRKFNVLIKVFNLVKVGLF